MKDGLYIDFLGTKFYYLNNLLHREDGPAVQAINGDKSYWIDGMLHREDGPAVEWSNGNKVWYIRGERLSEEEFNEKVKMIPIKKEFDDRIEYRLPNGDLHREDGPAVEYSNGGKQWYINGKLHREDGPAVEWEDGARWWYLHGKLHREGDLPAVVLPSFNSFTKNATKFWYNHGKLHRKNGPAIEYFDGYKCHYLNGQYYSEQDYCKEIERESLNHILSNVKNNLNKSKSIKKSLFFSLAFLWIISNSDKKLENRIEAHKEEEIESSKLLVGHKSNNQLY